MRLRLALLVLLTLLAACSRSGTPSAPPDATPEIAWIEITPSSLLFTRAGESRTLAAQAYNARGEPVDAAITWLSEDPDQVSVTPDGLVTSLASLGSGQVVAQADGVASAPAQVVIADPVDGAVLVADEQVLSEATLVNPEHTDIVGGRFEVLLAGAPALPAGTILLAAESAPIAGAVVSASPEGDATRVVFEVLPVDALFDALLVHQTFDLAAATAPDALEPAASRTGLAAQAERFSCDGEAGAKLDVGTLSVEQAPLGTVVVTLDKPEGQPVRTFGIVYQGELAVQASGGVFLQAGLEGSATCTLRIRDIPVRATGVLSVLVNPVIGVDGELAVQGSVSGVTVEAGLNGKVGVAVELGFRYEDPTGTSADLTFLQSYTPLLELKPTYKAPSIDDARVDVAVTIGPVVSLRGRALDLGFVHLLDASLIEARAGLRGEVSLASVDAQAVDTGYASAYSLFLRGQLGLGDGLQRAAEAMGIEAGELEPGANTLTLDSPPLARSPTGTLALDRQQAAPGDPVSFRVDLENVSFPLFGYNVEEVRLYHFRDGHEPALLDTIPVRASNQTSFVLDWTVPHSWPDGEYRIAAFVNPWLADGLPLEVGPNSLQTLVIGGVCRAPEDGGTVGDPEEPGGTTEPAPSDDPPCGGDVTYAYESEDRNYVGDEGGYEAWVTTQTLTANDLVFVRDTTYTEEGIARYRIASGTIASFQYERVYRDSQGLECTSDYWLDEPVRLDGDALSGYIEVAETDLERAGRVVPEGTYNGFVIAGMEVQFAQSGECMPGSGTSYNLYDVLYIALEEGLEGSPYVVQAGDVLSGTYVHERGTVEGLSPAQPRYSKSSSTWNFTMPGVSGD